MTSIFISYDRDDRPLTQQLSRQLRRVYGFDQVWYDENIRGGQDWWNEIRQQIAGRDIFIYLLSNESARSPYCHAEHAEAKRLNKEVLPVRIEPITDIPDFLKQIQYVDMSEGQITVENFTELNAAIKQISDKIEADERRRLAANLKSTSRWGRVAVPLAILILLAVGLLVTTPPPPFRGQIIYTSGRAALSSLMLNTGGFNGLIGGILGRNPSALPGQVASESPAAWSPDGTKIAFAQRGEIGLDLYVMNADGSNVQRLTADGANNHYPAWSPDGTQLAFSTDAGDGSDGNTEIVVISIDFSDPANIAVTEKRAITTDPFQDDYPAWSPDGSQIAFSSNRNGVWDIYIADPQGGSLIQMTADNGDNEAPAWSPDGTQIAFESNRERKLGANILPGSTSQPESETAFVNWDIYVMDVEGPGIIPFTKSPAADRYPRWSPDGEQLVFTSDRDGDFDLYLVETADRANVTLLTENTDNDIFASWRA